VLSSGAGTPVKFDFQVNFPDLDGHGSGLSLHRSFVISSFP
jgi:hypothetical protein